MALSKKGKSFLGLFLVFTPACLLIFFATRGAHHKFERLASYGKLKPFEFTDVKGNKRSSDEFKGDILLVTTLQNSCPNDCALLLYHLDKILYQEIKKNSKKLMKRVRLLSIVTDKQGVPERDLTLIQEKLKNTVMNYDPALWILATANPKEVFNFKSNGLSLLEKNPKFYGGVAFQEVILLLDKNHELRMVLNGKLEGYIRRMKESLALLQKEYDQQRALSH